MRQKVPMCFDANQCCDVYLKASEWAKNKNLSAAQRITAISSKERDPLDLSQADEATEV
jgi:hypothetical protein